jgi:hypothetical protein
MNYIWDMAIKATRQDIEPATITFVHSKSCSPYMEMAFEDLNTVSLEAEPTVEINPYYRFCDIFKKFLDINFTGHEEIQAVFFDIITHYLLFIDCHQGLCKREYYGKFILNDIEKGVFGQRVKESLNVFSVDERHILLNGLTSLYRTSASVHLFKQVVRQIFVNGIIYYRSEDTPEVLIYLGTAETAITRLKTDTLLALFLPLGFAFRLYWEKHFGIIGADQTMEIDNIVIY